jgi:hypothetical protein
MSVLDGLRFRVGMDWLMGDNGSFRKVFGEKAEELNLKERKDEIFSLFACSVVSDGVAAFARTKIITDLLTLSAG